MIPTTLLAPRNESIFMQIDTQYQFNNEFNLWLHFFPVICLRSFNFKH